MSQNSDKDEECAVCLQKFMQPVILPCRHTFCFLCAKGMSIHSRKCALCRKKIPDNYLLRPKVVDDHGCDAAPDSHQYMWYYQGNQGWWQYDERTNAEVEGAFKESKQEVKVMISGFIYVIDFQRMAQYREQYPQRSRAIKRDLVNIPDKKGVAGLSDRLLQAGGRSQNSNLGQGTSSNPGHVADDDDGAGGDDSDEHINGVGGDDNDREIVGDEGEVDNGYIVIDDDDDDDENINADNVDATGIVALYDNIVSTYRGINDVDDAIIDHVVRTLGSR